ncbi:MAG: hypothetical protein PVI43_01055 [Candidatus Bathyarchaeota archaeon]|jgi:hypothetical protein
MEYLLHIVNILTVKALSYYDEVKIGIVVLYGAMIQFMFTEKKSWSVLFMIGASSMFVALILVKPFIIEPLEIEDGSNMAYAIIATSSVISVPILSIMISFLPGALKQIVIQKFGLKNENFK